MEQTSKIDNVFRYFNSKILIMGGKESGKTTLVRDIYNEIQDQIDEVHVFSNVSSNYTDITNAIYDDFNMLHNFCISAKEHLDTRKLLIIENLIDKNQVKLLEELLFNGKHYNVTIIVTLQYPLVMQPEFRHQFNYIFSSFYDFIADQQKLYNYYFGMFHSLENFQRTFNTLQPFEFMGVKMQSSPYVIKYKPNMHSNLRFIPTTVRTKVHVDEKTKNIIKQIDHIITALNKLKEML